MSRMAVMTPNHDPVYLANCGFEAWNRILTRSRGPTTVLACAHTVSTCPFHWRRSNTYSASSQTASQTAAHDIIPGLLVNGPRLGAGLVWQDCFMVGGTYGRLVRRVG